jgi:hypothetical protein
MKRLHGYGMSFSRAARSPLSDFKASADKYFLYGHKLFSLLQIHRS